MHACMVQSRRSMQEIRGRGPLRQTGSEWTRVAIGACPFQSRRCERAAGGWGKAWALAGEMLRAAAEALSGGGKTRRRLGKKWRARERMWRDVKSGPWRCMRWWFEVAGGQLGGATGIGRRRGRAALPRTRALCRRRWTLALADHYRASASACPLPASASAQAISAPCAAFDAVSIGHVAAGPPRTHPPTYILYSTHPPRASSVPRR
ncbi:hypothetical protein EJ04DRAFT_238556 [Polyplosphaeria fusca]|uniref:Uncharacterized protein n=1 Tax=Polyplosphaeria fusca TaxID=682080 RepID=A0A9P4R6M5_9PLEO|nr:hypothetical protein EJ04DRAFT_238556 [Polyplosphaeria fusca]